MFIDTDKIGLMATIRKDQWKGTTVKEDYDNLMAEKAKGDEAIERQRILDVLSGKLPDTGSIYVNGKWEPLEIHEDPSLYVEKGYVYDTYSIKSGFGGKVRMSTADAEKLRNFGKYYSNIDRFSPDAGYEQNKDKYVMNDPFKFHGITTHVQNPDGTYNRYLNNVFQKVVDTDNAYTYTDFKTAQKDRLLSYFFTASTDFLMEAAQEYAKIGKDQEYVYRPTNDDQFVRSAVDFFARGMAGKSDYKAMSKSIDGIVRELAEKIKNGEDTSLEKVTSKLDILGEKVSLSDLLQMREQSKAFMNAMGTRISFSTDSLAQSAQKGMIKAVAKSYGDKIGGRIGQLYSAAIGEEIDNRFRRTIEHSENSSSVQVKAAVDSGRELYDLFSKLDGTNANTFKSSFDSIKGQMESILAGYNGKLMNMADINKYRNEINSYFASAQSFIG